MIKRSATIAWLAPLVAILALLAGGCQEFDRLRLILKPEQFPEGLNGPHRVSIRVVPLLKPQPWNLTVAPFHSQRPPSYAAYVPANTGSFFARRATRALGPR